MRRNALAALIRLGVAAALAISLASCGTTRSLPPGASVSATSSTSSSASSRLTVSPSSGGPTTTFSLRFSAPVSSGDVGQSRLGYTVSLTGPARRGCIGARSVQVPSALKDTAVPIALDPARLGGAWCAGTHTARAVEIESPVCTAGTMCPQFLRVVGTVGTATFRVLRSS